MKYTSSKCESDCTIFDNNPSCNLNLGIEGRCQSIESHVLQDIIH